MFWFAREQRNILFEQHRHGLWRCSDHWWNASCHPSVHGHHSFILLPEFHISKDSAASCCQDQRLSSLSCSGGSYSKPWLWQAVKQTHTDITLSKTRENKYKQNNEKLAAAASYSPLAVSAIGTGDEITNKDLLQRWWNRQESLEGVNTVLPPAQRAAVLFLQPSTAAGRSTWMGSTETEDLRLADVGTLVMKVGSQGLRAKKDWGRMRSWEMGSCPSGDEANKRTRGGSERNKTER